MEANNRFHTDFQPYELNKVNGDIYMRIDREGHPLHTIQPEINTPLAILNTTDYNIYIRSQQAMDCGTDILHKFRFYFGNTSLYKSPNRKSKSDKRAVTNWILPAEISNMIFAYIHGRDYINISLVSLGWNHLTNINGSWMWKLYRKSLPEPRDDFYDCVYEFDTLVERANQWEQDCVSSFSWLNSNDTWDTMELKVCLIDITLEMIYHIYMFDQWKKSLNNANFPQVMRKCGIEDVYFFRRTSMRCIIASALTLEMARNIGLIIQISSSKITLGTHKNISNEITIMACMLLILVVGNCMKMAKKLIKFKPKQCIKAVSRYRKCAPSWIVEALVNRNVIKY
eukprot:TRINITY_DN7070_c0_g1_i3.p1 TRINITY_DN7070_c0_g1~~TRINITY_DN7070_c0_g1_i3.p1  ORF type:complete len:341 (-),score=40.03 TRINITY_DN7070_c0_g1_i3:9-1031(-)